MTIPKMAILINSLLMEREVEGLSMLGESLCIHVFAKHRWRRRTVFRPSLGAAASNSHIACKYTVCPYIYLRNIIIIIIIILGEN